MRDFLLDTLFWLGVPLGILFILVMWALLTLLAFDKAMELLHDNYNDEDNYS